MHFKKFKNSDPFFPAIFINYRLFKEKLYDKPLLLYILKYETINLFRTQSEWINFYSKLYSSLNNISVIAIINQIASLYIDNYSKQKFLIIIDEYSTKYDKDNDIDYFKKICKDIQIFDIFIIYSIETIEDQKFFIQKFTKNIFIESEKLDILSPNYIRFENHEVSCYYKYEYRNYNLLKKHFEKDIPDKYEFFLVIILVIFFNINVVKIVIDHLLIF